MATTEVNREQWLEQRRKFIGGSDAASLFPSDSKYGCPRRLVLDKRGTPPDYDYTERQKALFERGNELEEAIADKFSRDYGFKIRRVPTFVNKEKPFIGVNMDRRIEAATTEQVKLFWKDLELEGECGPGYLECKSSNPWDFRKLKEGIAPDYVFQVQHGIGARGYKWGVLAVLEPVSFEMLAFPFVAHRELIKQLQQRAEELWEYVVNPDLQLMPIPEFQDGMVRCRSCPFRRTCLGTERLLQMAEEKPDTGYVADDSYSELASDLKEIREQASILAATEDEIRKRIQDRMVSAGQSKIEIPSCGVRISWAEQKGAMRWDTKGLEAEHPELAEKYKRASAPSRPFKFVQI